MNWENIMAIAEQVFFWVGVVVSAATIIVKATPSQKDDAVLDKIIKVLDYVSVVNPNGTRTLKIGKSEQNG